MFNTMSGPFLHFLIPLLTAAGLSFSATAAIVGDPVPNGGTTIELENQPGLHLVVQDRHLVAHFVDAAGNAFPSPAESIIFVVDDPGHRHDDFRTLLRPGEDARLTSPRTLTPPYDFRIRLIIRMKEGDSVILSNERVDLDPQSKAS